MRRLATLVIVASMLPAFGASPEEPGFSLSLPSSIDLALPGFSERKYVPSARRSAAGSPSIRIPASKCYYMGQINKDLQKPKEKPELLRLAEADVSPQQGGKVDCLTAALEPLATGR